MAKIPGLDLVTSGLLSVLQAQTAALQALPGAVADLSTAVRNLSEATAGARETMQTMTRLATKMEGLVDDLTPGLQRVAVVLDDPVISTLPESLTKVQRDLLPVLRTIAETNERIAGLASLPGASLLGLGRKVSPPASLPPSDRSRPGTA